MSSKKNIFHKLNLKAFCLTLIITIILENYLFWNYFITTQKQIDSLKEKVFSQVNSKYSKNLKKVESNIPERITLNDNIYDTYIVDLKSSNLTFYHTDKQGNPIEKFSNLRDYIEKNKKKLVFATNGGIFLKNLESLGLYVENGKEVSPLNRQKGTDNFFIEPNGVFYIKNGKANIEKTDDFNEKISEITFATQSGPMLVVDNEFNSKFSQGSENKNIRSGVGIIDEYKIVFAISDQPVNFFDFANLFKNRFQCKNALYLDGAISKMYLPELNKSYLDSNISFGSFICVEINQ
jgi:uncharacterized protein YigE (DUF2233 family)